MDPADTPLPLPSHFDLLRGSQNLRLTVQMNPNTPVSSAPKRLGAPLDTSSNKERRTFLDHDDTSGDISLADFGVLSWNDKHIRLDVNGADIEHAAQHPALIWPSFERLYGAPPGSI